MRIGPMAIIRALAQRVTAEERTQLAMEFLTGAAAAPRADQLDRQPVKSAEESE